MLRGGWLGAVAVGAAWGLLTSGCGAKHVTHAPRGNDAFSIVAAAELNRPCEAVPEAGAVPALGQGPRPPSNYAVVAYFPHPYDEAFFTSGTLTRLGQGHHKTAVVLLSHGEGGRVLEVNASGEFVEREDLPREKVAATRDAETDKAAKAMGIEATHVYPSSMNTDFGKTLSCEETLERWDATVPGGLPDLLRRLVEVIRVGRPRVVITNDTRSEGHWFEHGHNKAMGALVEIAARMAADPRVTARGDPWIVEEVLAVVPPGSPRPDVSITVGEGTRKNALQEYPSQFRVDKVADVSTRKVEDYVLVWRAKGVPDLPTGSVLGDVIAHPE